MQYYCSKKSIRLVVSTAGTTGSSRTAGATGTTRTVTRTIAARTITAMVSAGTVTGAAGTSRAWAYKSAVSLEDQDRAVGQFHGKDFTIELADHRLNGLVREFCSNLISYTRRQISHRQRIAAHAAAVVGMIGTGAGATARQAGAWAYEGTVSLEDQNRAVGQFHSKGFAIVFADDRLDRFVGIFRCNLIDYTRRQISHRQGIAAQATAIEGVGTIMARAMMWAAGANNHIAASAEQGAVGLEDQDGTIRKLNSEGFAAFFADNGLDRSIRVEYCQGINCSLGKGVHIDGVAFHAKCGVATAAIRGQQVAGLQVSGGKYVFVTRRNQRDCTDRQRAKEEFLHLLN